MSIRLLYFGMLRQIANCEEDVVAIESGTTVADFIAQLRREQLRRYEGKVFVAINREHALDEYILSDGDEVAIMPPFAGG